MSTNDSIEEGGARILVPVTAFLWAEFALNVGRGYLLIVFTLLLYRTSGSLWNNLVYVTSDVLFAFVAPLLAGVWVDRKGPGGLLFRSVTLMSLVLLVCGGLAWGNEVSAASVLAASLITGMLNACVRVCVFTLTPALAAKHELMQINGRQQVAFQLGNLSGVLLAGALFDQIGLGASFLIVAAFTAMASLGYRQAVIGLARPSDIPGFTRNLRAGFFQLVPALFQKKMLIALFALGASDLIAISMFNLMLPVLVTTHFGGQSFALAIVDSFYTVGSVVLGWMVGRFALKGRELHPLLLLMPVVLLSTMLQSIWFNRITCFVVVFGLGFLVSSYTVYFTATIQALVPAALRGRFAALRRMVSTVVVSGTSAIFAASYANQGLVGAVWATMGIALAILAGGIGWVWMRRGSYELLLANIREGCTADRSEYDDLKPIFDPLLQLASTGNDRRS
ncbi:MFS transporter [Pseudomonas cucumis]|uniref:MFS transporter n=1 Tax=Pseudomonas cucumis TaxID=2954082 RepID=A0ABY9F2R3_9PSED|nr:MFS transporter [Pseudomonas cucumis]WLG85678.1 MFS transporter [Pseudomonas cucumis]